MSTDIVLDTGEGKRYIDVHAAGLRIQGEELVLDNSISAIGKGAKTRKRKRALRHDDNNGLSINPYDEYPGGVTVNSQDGINVNAAALRVNGSDITLDSKGRRKKREGHRRALVHDTGDGLTINYEDDYPGGVTINSARVLLRSSHLLPDVGTTGELFVVTRRPSRIKPKPGETLADALNPDVNLYLCVRGGTGKDSPAAWKQVQLLD